MDFLYKKPLHNNNSLEVYSNNTLIFCDNGKWLNPIFHLEEFLNNKSFDNLSVHDTAIGKAALILFLRLGIKKIHGNLVSRLALLFVEEYNSSKVNTEEKIELSYDNLVDRLMCATEQELSNMVSIDEMYFRLRQRANLVCGVSVDVSSLTYHYGNINNLSFSLHPGSHLMVIGENGSGKTTLLRLLCGIYKSDSGEILIDGKKIKDNEKFTIGYIPQQTDNADFSLSVEEVVGLGIKGSCKNKRARIKEALERTSSSLLISRSYNSLSGGEKQKVNLSRCLAQNAKLLLMDEPTSSLDKENRKMVVDIIRSLTVTEIPTIIIATHDKALSSLPGWERIVIGEDSNE